MLLLVTVGAFLVVSLVPFMEPETWAAGILISLVLIWRRSAQFAVPRDMLRLLAFPFLLLCVELHGIYTHPLTDFLKDCWYFSLPLVYLTTGYLAFERAGRWERFMQPLIIVGMGFATYGLIHAVLNRGELADAASVDAYRTVTGTGTFGPMVPLVLVLLARRAGLPAFGVERWKNIRGLIYVVSAGAVLITFSRTHIIMLLLALLSGFSYRSILRRVVHSGGVGMIVALVALGAGTYYVAHAKSGPVQLFVNKVMHSGSEVQIRAYETFEQINNNWRGYEAYRASKTFAKYDTTDKIFGGGGGSMVDLGFAMQLSSTQYFKYVPITHNGYMYILIKDGICGIALFALFVIQLLWTARKALRLRDPEARMAGLLLLWTPLVFAATQGVITGIYNKGELVPVLFLAGAAMASYSQRRRAFEAVQDELRWRAVRMHRGNLPSTAFAAGEASSA